jgi:hypothetical protein
VEVRHLYADPLASPFVLFGGGYAVFPPNTLHAVADELLSTLAAGESPESAERRLVHSAWIGGTNAIHPASTWAAVLSAHFRFWKRHFPSEASLVEVVAGAIRLMTHRPHEDAWGPLCEYIVKHVDVLSGWSSHWVRDDPDAKRTERADDGTYFVRETDGSVMVIHGGKTLPETRLDFINHSVLHGSIGNVLALFALFALSDDFARRPTSYPLSMRLLVFPESEYTAYTWERRELYRVREVVWRPDSNLCDRFWLAQTLVAKLVDRLDFDAWNKSPVTRTYLPPSFPKEYPYQRDYTLDTSLRVGTGPEEYFEFRGAHFRWINGTIESSAVLSVACKSRDRQIEEAEAADRLISYLAYKHGVVVAHEGAVGGPRRALPHTWSPRQAGNLVVGPEHLLGSDFVRFSEDRWFGLALYKEAINARSIYYAFFSYWRIVELAIPDHDGRAEWVNYKAAQWEGSGRASSVNIFPYLHDHGRNSIAHVRRPDDRPAPIDPDDASDSIRVRKDMELVRWLAEGAIDLL